MFHRGHHGPRRLQSVRLYGPRGVVLNHANHKLQTAEANRRLKCEPKMRTTGDLTHLNTHNSIVGIPVPVAYRGGSRNCWWGGCWVQTIGRAAAAGRPEARSAGGRPGGGFGRGSPSTPSRKGVRGYHPRENFEILYRKRCILVHYKWLPQYYFAFKNP